MEFSKITKKYWKEEDWVDLNKAKNVSSLYVIAKRIIDRMPKPIFKFVDQLKQVDLVQ